MDCNQFSEPNEMQSTARANRVRQQFNIIEDFGDSRFLLEEPVIGTAIEFNGVSSFARGRLERD